MVYNILVPRVINRVAVKEFKGRYHPRVVYLTLTSFGVIQEIMGVGVGWDCCPQHVRI